MAKQKRFGSPFSKTVGKVIDEIAPEILDSAMDVAGGPGKSKKSSLSSSGRSPDWATHASAPGWQTPGGPLALPARWRADVGGLETCGGAMTLAGAASGSPASACAEHSRYRLNSTMGLLLIGDGHARPRTTGPPPVSRSTFAGRHGGRARSATASTRQTSESRRERNARRP